MTTYVAILVAQAAPQDGPGADYSFLFLMGAMFVLFYALLIRPQQRQQKEHRKMLEQVQRGDQIVTNGGIHGRVTGITDDVLTVEIASNVRIKLQRSAVSSRTSGGEDGKESRSAARAGKEKSA